MNLLTLTTRYYVWLLLGLLIICSGIFYGAMRYAVNSNIDEVLYNRRNTIVHLLADQNGPLPAQVTRYSDFSIRALPDRQPVDTTLFYRDTLIFEPTDQEFDEYRKLSTQVTVQGRPYALTIVRTHLEIDEIVGTISATLLSLYGLLVVGLLLAGRFLTRRLWTPFYTTLHQLAGFDLDQYNLPAFTQTGITEFDILNQNLSELTARTHKTYQHQKQFIENASHEMQTPLAIMQSKIELLYQQPALDQTQATLLLALNTQTERLSRLNKALLLLAKIDNHQYSDRTNVVWAEVVKHALPYFEEQVERKQLRVELSLSPEARVHTNPVLADILVTNLLKNAFVHNLPQGVVRIRTEDKTLIVENSGEDPGVAPQELFERFRKASRQKQTLGLGLAIVKSIVDANGWRIDYTYRAGFHRLAVQYEKGLNSG